MRVGMFGTGRRFFSSLLFAILFILVGIIIASMLDLPTSPAAKDRPDLPATARLSDRPVDFSTPFINAVASTRDAVVNISAESDMSGRPMSIEEYFQFFGMNHPRTARSYGSGFLFRDDGYILTNNHVVAGADKVIVGTSKDEIYRAKVVGTDPETDLAVIKIEPKEKLPYIPFGHSDDLQIGEWVLAIGNPFPQQGLDRTVTAGVVSAKGRKNLTFSEGDVIYQNYIQTDASINPGNSGGPLINLRGEAVGVNAAISTPSGGSVGIGFAIPIDYARAVVPDLIANGKVIRGWLGISPRDVPKDMADELHIPDGGVIFDSVTRGSPASEAGVRPGDVLVEFDGKAVHDAQDFRFQVATTTVGKNVELKLIRNGQPVMLNVTIGNRTQALHAIQSPAQQPYTEDYWMGMQVADCDADLASKFGVDCAPNGGVIVTGVIPHSPAYKNNIVPGVVITEIDKYEVKDLNDYRSAVASLKDRKKPISFIIYDTEGNMRWVGINPER
jgi:serine protease Do